MTELTPFEAESVDRIKAIGADQEMRDLTAGFLRRSSELQYSYNFFWMGRPIIQYPQDMAAMQELVWQTRPDLIIETGIAHGGSLIMNASLLALLDMCDAITDGTPFDPRSPRRKVLGVDIDIREHNRKAIEAHPMSNRIDMLQGSSIAEDILAQVRDYAAPFKRVLVSLDSNHTHEHVLAELEAYAPLVTSGSYCIVFDTIVEDMPEGTYPDRPWSKGNNPKTAVWKYLETHPEFSIDRAMHDKLQITVAPDGFLKRA